MEMVQATIQGTRWFLHVIICLDGKSIGQDFNTDAFVACSMSTIEAISRCKFLWVYSIPPPGGCKAFQIVSPLKNSESSRFSKNCDISSFFELFMVAIKTTATPCLTDMSPCDRDAVL